MFALDYLSVFFCRALTTKYMLQVEPLYYDLFKNNAVPCLKADVLAAKLVQLWMTNGAEGSDHVEPFGRSHTSHSNMQGLHI